MNFQNEVKTILFIANPHLITSTIHPNNQLLIGSISLNSKRQASRSFKYCPVVTLYLILSYGALFNNEALPRGA